MRNNQCIYEGSLVIRSASASKLFHSYVRRRKNGCLSVGSYKSRYGRIVFNATNMSELLVNAFSAVFVEDAPIAAQHQRFGDLLDKVYVSPENIKVLSGLNSSSAAGPDCLNPHLLTALSYALSLLFYLLFERFLDDGVLPNLRKTSIVAQLYKNYSRCDSLNYSLVSFTSVCCKVLERVIVSQVVD